MSALYDTYIRRARDEQAKGNLAVAQSYAVAAERVAADMRSKMTPEEQAEFDTKRLNEVLDLIRMPTCNDANREKR